MLLHGLKKMSKVVGIGTQPVGQNVHTGLQGLSELETPLVISRGFDRAESSQVRQSTYLRISYV